MEGIFAKIMKVILESKSKYAIFLKTYNFTHPFYMAVNITIRIHAHAHVHVNL